MRFQDKTQLSAEGPEACDPEGNAREPGVGQQAHASVRLVVVRLGDRDGAAPALRLRHDWRRPVRKRIERAPAWSEQHAEPPQYALERARGEDAHGLITVLIRRMITRYANL